MYNFTKDNIYIVAGASSGIGEAAATMLNEEGAAVIAIARNEQRLNSIREKCKHKEIFHIEVKDLTENIENLPQYVKSLKDKYGKFSGLVYTAGATAIASLAMIDYRYMIDVFNLHYFAPILMAKAVADRRNNIGQGCSMVFLSSIDALSPCKGQPMYSGAKSALSATIRSISKEVTAYGVRVNCILPSMINTPMTNSDEIQSKDEKSELYPFGWGKPSDTGNMILYLLSDKARYISGQNYVLDSGGIL